MFGSVLNLNNVRQAVLINCFYYVVFESICHDQLRQRHQCGRRHRQFFLNGAQSLDNALASELIRFLWAITRFLRIHLQTAADDPNQYYVS